MRRKQRSKLIDIIKRGAHIASYYFRLPSKAPTAAVDDCEACIIGSMILATTPPGSKLRTELANHNGSGLEKLPPAVLNHLRQEFGLTAGQLNTLQLHNDDHKPQAGSDYNPIADRRADLLKVVDTLPMEMEDEAS